MRRKLLSLLETRISKLSTILLGLVLLSGVAVGQTTISYDFSDGGAVTGLNEATPGIALDANIGFGSFKNSAGTNPAIYSGQLRLYQNATKGGSIKIYASNGVTITKVIVHASSRTGPAQYSVDGVGSTDVTISYGAYTVVGLSATSYVEFYQKDASSSNRIYVDDFEVTYTSGASCSENPSITTTVAVSSITSTSVSSGGQTLSAGTDCSIIEKGVCWSTSTSPDITDSKTDDGTGTTDFISEITGLTASTTYYVRSYVTNGFGTAYGPQISFTTNADPCATAQTLPFFEGFENGGSIPDCWTEDFISGTTSWTYIDGGNSGNPSSSHTGNYNALFYAENYDGDNTKLISPSIDVSTGTNVKLSFWHTQTDWSGDQDELRIYYKNSSGGTWNLIETYANSISAWTQETITLTNLSNDYYIAFDGLSGYGYGVGIDDILIEDLAPTSEINIQESATNYLTGSTYDFGDVENGSSSAVKTFTIQNTGTAALAISGSPKIAISGTSSTEYTIVQTSTSASIAASGTTTFTIQFNPSGTGNRPAVISIANDDSDENPYTITLAGNGTAVDNTAPTVTTFSPLDNASDVAINTGLVLTFDETVQVGTGNIVIKEVSGGTTFQTIAIGSTIISGSTVTISHTDFANSTAYYVEIASGVITDAATTPNDYAGLSGNSAWNFTTEAVAVGGCATDLIISEYCEGSSNNKYIEVYNGTGSTINFANTSYSINKSGNGGGWGTAYALTGTLDDGDVFILANTSATSTITNAADATDVVVAGFNGNDAIGLFKGTTLIDVVGDPSSSDYFASNVTLVRNSDITEPTASYLSTEWTSNDEDDFDDIGSHTMSCSVCETPTNQPTALILNSNTTYNSIDGSFTAAATGSVGADGYLIVRSEAPVLSADPSNATTYSTGDALGGGFVVDMITSTSFTATSLNPLTQYNFYIFSYQNTDCSGGPMYNINSPLTEDETTPAGPSITVTQSLTDFGDVCTSSTGTEQSYTISGSNLSSDIIITAPTGFIISTTIGNDDSPITLSQSSGTVNNTTIYVNFTPSSTGVVTGNITNVVSGDAISDNVAVSGIGIGTGSISTTAISSVTTTTATSGGTSISAAGTISEKGVCWNTITLPTISNSKLAAGNTTTADFTSNLTGLTAGTTYYVRAYVTNDCGIAYGNEVSFTTLKAEPTNVPTSFACSNPSSSTIDLTWTNSVGDADGYIIKYATSAGLTDPVDGTAEADVVGIKNVTDGTGAVTISGLTPLTTYYFEIWPYNNSGTDIAYKTDVAAVIDNETTLDGPFVPGSFENGPLGTDGWTTVEYTGDTDDNWIRDHTDSYLPGTNNGANSTNHWMGIIGYNNYNDGWLISPAMDVSQRLDLELKFWYWWRNLGTADVMVKVSTDYGSHVGIPTDATWTDVTPSYSATDQTWIQTAAIDLSAYDNYSASNLYVAFHLDGTSASGYGSSDDTNWAIDEIEVSGTLSTGDQTSDIEPPTSQVATNASMSALADTQGEAIDVFTFKITDDAATDALTTDVTQITVKPAGANTADWTNNIAGVSLSTGTIGAVTITDTEITIPITAGSLEITNGGSTEVTLAMWFVTSGTVEDGKNLQFTVSSADHACTTVGTKSRFKTSLTGATSNIHTIDVSSPSKLVFTSNTDTWGILNENTVVEVGIVDANGNIDADATNSITVSKASGSGTVSSVTGLTQSTSTGIYTWSDVLFDEADTYTLTATAAGLTSATIGNIVIETPVTELVITEIADKGHNEEYNGEYIEISNMGNYPADLYDGWTLEYYNATGLEMTIDDFTQTIQPGEAFVVAARVFPYGYIFADYIPDEDHKFFMNSNSYVILKKDGVIKDQAGASTDEFEVDKNYEFTNCGGDNLAVSAWTSHGTGNGTPGAVNCNCSEPTQASALASSGETLSTIGLTWTRGDGDRVVIFASEDDDRDVFPNYGTTYTANEAYGYGDMVKPGCYVVYDGTGTFTTVTNLSAPVDYTFHIFEYNTVNHCYNMTLGAGNVETIPTNCSEPTTAATTAVTSGITDSQFTLSWTNGDGEGRVVLVHAGSVVDGNPEDNTTYLANANFGSGAAINTNNYVVYDGTGSSVTITGLTGGTTYYYEVFEYNCIPGSENYELTNTLVGDETTSMTIITDLAVSCKTSTTAKITWTAPTGTYTGVIIGIGTSEPSALSGDANGYSDNLEYLSGTTYDGASSVVYKGTGTSAIVTGLTAGADYEIKACVYQNETGTSWAPVTPTTSITNLAVNDVENPAVITASGQMEVLWTNPTAGCYDEIMIVAKEDESVTFSPTGDGSAYTADAAFDGGTPFDGGFVVYKGTGTSFTVTDVINYQDYCFKFFVRKGNDWSEGVVECETPTDQTILDMGDIAIISVNTGTDEIVAGNTGVDEICFFSFVDIVVGTNIDFTDNGWNRGSEGYFGTGEGVIRLHYSGEDGGTTIEAGTVMCFRGQGDGYNSAGAQYDEFDVRVCGSTDSLNWDVSNISETVPGGLYDLNIEDQIWIMQGGEWDHGTGNDDASYSGNILYGWTATGWKSAAGYNDSHGSMLYPGAECYNTNAGVETDAAKVKYTGPITKTTRSGWLLRINDNANWSSYAHANAFDNTTWYADEHDRFYADECYVFEIDNPDQEFEGSTTPGYWTGAGGTEDWFYCANWGDLRIPTSSTDVTIRAASEVENPVVIDDGTNSNLTNAEATCKSIVFQDPSTTVIMSDPNSILNVYGDFIHNGAFTATDGKVFFKGTSAQFISGLADITFNNLEIVNTSSSGVTLNTSIEIANSLTLTDGVITTGTNEVILSNTSATSLLGGTSASSINGNFRRYIASNEETYMFNLSNGTTDTDYHPMSIINNNLAGVTSINASVSAITNSGDNIDDNFPDITEDDIELGDILEGAVWSILPDAEPSGGNYGVRLYLDNISDLSASDDNKFFAVKRSNGSTNYADWTNVPDAGASPVEYSVGFAERTGYSTFSEHAIVKEKETTPLPIELLNFNAIRIGEYVNIDWSTATEKNNDFFTIERSRDANNFEFVTNYSGAGNSFARLNYDVVDYTPYSKKSYYRLKQTDYDGTFTYSNIVAVDGVESMNSENISIFNNGTGIQVEIETSVDIKCHIKVVDMMGRILYQNVYQSNSNSILFIDSSNYAPGIYNVTVFNTNTVKTQKVFIN